MAAPRAARAGSRQLREAEAEPRGTACGRSQLRFQGDNLQDYHSSTSLTDLTITELGTTGEILGSFSSCIDQSIISIIEDTSQIENKSHLDEENEATLLTALTEILDTFDDENASPFDSIPDSEIFALPKAGQDGSLVESYAVLPDLGKEPFGHVIPAAKKRWGSEKLANRGFGEISQQGSDSEGKEEEVLTSNRQGASESGSEMLHLETAEQLSAAGLESNVTLVIGSSFPCEHVSLSDLVKYIGPYCVPTGLLYPGTDADSAGNVIELEVQLVQDGELQDLELPMVLCENGECQVESMGENGTGLVTGEESVLTKNSGPENLPQTSEQQEVLPPPAEHQEKSPVTVRRRGRPRKTAKPTAMPVSGEQQDVAERASEHCSLQTRLQTAENKRKTCSEAQSQQADRNQESVAPTAQESRLPAQQGGEVELAVKRIQTRGRAAAGRESWQQPSETSIGQSLRKLPSSELQPTSRGLSFPQAQGETREPHPGPGETTAKQATHPEQTQTNIPSARAAEPAPTPRVPAPRAAEPAPAPTPRVPAPRAAEPAPAPTPRVPAPRAAEPAPAPAPRVAEPAPAPRVPAPRAAEPAPRAAEPAPAPTPRVAEPAPAPAPRAAEPAPAPRVPAPRAAEPAPMSPLPVCDTPSPAVLETTSSEPRLRPISLQQYRLRLQQRKQERVCSALEEPRSSDPGCKNAWPVVPIQSIVHGELSVLPLEPTG
ncbi:uncharacterized protein LOC144500838, partial [Mustelus asterias]